eukprot:gb/GECG01009289.1/.p1 GENE.gb/GECG01009289.1/~~gb/GECG01009289.1/.p1  ORF type:complete len:127 (+),score=4.52 gb/GECG01009289.1/:1-381(+)
MISTPMEQYLNKMSFSYTHGMLNTAKDLYVYRSFCIMSLSYAFLRPDATLGELASLVKEVFEPAREPDASLSMAIVHPDRSGRVIMREIGVVDATRPNREVEKKVLGSSGFQTGDFLDVAVERKHL